MLGSRSAVRWVGRSWLVASLTLGALGVMSGCKQETSPSATDAAGSTGPLTPEQAAKVLAKVGDRTITLGEYAETLERMDPFERLRYQSPERRKQLLDEMIQVELLAQEAERRGLHRTPETEERIRIVLRNEVLARLRRDIPGPESIPEAEVRKYYEAHRDEFREPARRRVAVISLADRAAATRLLPKAREATPMQWGKLVHEHSLDRPPAPSPTAPLELAGDLGIVSAPGVTRGANERIPEPVRAAVFKIEKVGQVHSEVVEAGGKHYLVRLIGKTDARDRPYAEAERSIRVTLVQEKIRAAEQRLEAELRKKHPVTVDDEALAKVRLPEASAAPPAPSGTPTAPSGERPDGSSGVLPTAPSAGN